MARVVGMLVGTMRILPSAVLLLLATGLAGAQQHPRDGEIHDADTLAWWHTTEALSNDAMEGRDTGSAVYQRAADYVAKRFKAAGLLPAGDDGTYFQMVPMHEVQVEPLGTSFVVERSGGKLRLDFLQEITVAASETALREGVGALAFRGYCGKDAMTGVAGKIVVCFGTQRAELPSGGDRAANAKAAGALGLVNVDDPYFTIEPPRWPYAYARSVTLRETAGGGSGGAAEGSMLPGMRLSAEAFAKLLAGSGKDAAEILKLGGAKGPLPNFEISGKLWVRLKLSSRDFSSPNVLAVRPGSDATLAGQYVVVAAHLDGYGYGTPVQGDNLYNGTLDDAAYVALLIQMADDLKAGAVGHHGLTAVSYAVSGKGSGQSDGGSDVIDKGITLVPTKRSILFCAFTGEEKGLLGSSWFVKHPTVPVEELAADINLDQLRPLFPLKILTAEAVNDTTLGATASAVGKGMGIEIREDREPERGLLRRADQYPFLRIHVPAISFIFGYDPGTDAERRYREWYEVRYHRPQDDLTQPVDFQAAETFDVFFYRLVETTADAPVRPAILPDSQFAEKK
jgi:Zn-dependent M28 family amino/carboxypeptidase